MDGRWGGDLRAGLNMLWSFGGSLRVVVFSIVAVQLLVPLIALAHPPARFGFQMYSGVGGVAVSVLDGQGDPIEFDHETVVAGEFRPDLFWVERLPEAVCERVPAAAQVTVSQGRETRTVSCDP